MLDCWLFGDGVVGSLLQLRYFIFFSRVLLTDVGDVTGNHKNWDAAGQSDIIQVENEEFRGFDNTHINSTPQGYYVVNGPVGFC